MHFRLFFRPMSRANWTQSRAYWSLLCSTLALVEPVAVKLERENLLESSDLKDLQDNSKREYEVLSNRIAKVHEAIGALRQEVAPRHFKAIHGYLTRGLVAYSNAVQWHLRFWWYTEDRRSQLAALKWDAKAASCFRNLLREFYELSPPNIEQAKASTRLIGVTLLEDDFSKRLKLSTGTKSQGFFIYV